MIRLNPAAALDASRVALLYALRRDWAPEPATRPWQAGTQRALVDIAAELRAEALALCGEGERA